MSGTAARAEATAVLRRGAETTLASLDALTTEIHERHLAAPGMERVRDDPVLRAASLRAIRATVAHWSAAVLDDPWAEVSAADDPDSLRMARDLVRRGLGDAILIAYRVAQVDAWRAWVAVATGLTSDPAVIRLVLDRSASSIGAFNERTLAVVQRVVDEERTLLHRGDLPQRREMIELLLDGAPVPAARASQRLGIDVTAPLTAMVLWSSHEATPALPAVLTRAELEQCVGAVLRTGAGPRPRGHVVTYPNTGVAWLWVGGEPASDALLAEALAPWPQVRAAIGELHRGLDGFRESH